jgi:hypothetical protein
VSELDADRCGSPAHFSAQGFTSGGDELFRSDHETTSHGDHLICQMKGVHQLEWVTYLSSDVVAQTVWTCKVLACRKGANMDREERTLGS